MTDWVLRIINWALDGFFYNYSSALRYYAPGMFDAENSDLEEGYYG